MSNYNGGVMSRRPETVSVGDKIKHCKTLIASGDLTGWNKEFITSMAGRYEMYKENCYLSDKQMYYLDRIWVQNFGNAVDLPILPEAVAEKEEPQKPKGKFGFDSYGDDDIPF